MGESSGRFTRQPYQPIERAICPQTAGSIPLAVPVSLRQDLIEAMPVGVYVCDQRGVVIAYNKRASELWGREPVCGKTQERFCGAHKLFLADGTYVDHEDTPIATALRTHAPTGEFEAIVGRADGTRIPVLASASPLFDDDGQFVGFVNCVQNLSAVRSLAADVNESRAERQAAEARAYKTEQLLEQLQNGENDRRLLADELQHRVKNILAVVQSLVNQTMRWAENPETAAYLIAERLAALSRSYDILLEGDWQGASLMALVKSALEFHPIDANRIVISGKLLSLTGREVLGLSLVLHELTTNAIQYGALSTDNGIVEISWTIVGNNVEFIWQETGGPLVESPVRRGFGTRLLDRALAGPTRTTKIDYLPSGVRWTLDTPLEGFAEEAGVAGI